MGADKRGNISNLEQQLAVQASLFDSKISTMQGELDSRLDEIQISKNVDVESVKAEYITLFDEKAKELQKLRSEHEGQATELESTRKLLADQQYQAHEFQQQVKQERSCHEQKLEESIRKVTNDLEMFRNHDYAQLESELAKLRNRYDQLQLSYLNAVTSFKTASLRVEGRGEGSATTCDSFTFNEENVTTPPLSLKTLVGEARPLSSLAAVQATDDANSIEDGLLGSESSLTDEVSKGGTSPEDADSGIKSLETSFDKDSSTIRPDKNISNGQPTVSEKPKKRHRRKRRVKTPN